jgi:hypothetical protein
MGGWFASVDRRHPALVLVGSGVACGVMVLALFEREFGHRVSVTLAITTTVIYIALRAVLVSPWKFLANEHAAPHEGEVAVRGAGVVPALVVVGIALPVYFLGLALKPVIPILDVVPWD